MNITEDSKLLRKTAEQMARIGEGPGGVEEVLGILIAHARVLGQIAALSAESEREFRAAVLAVQVLVLADGYAARKWKEEEGGK